MGCKSLCVPFFVLTRSPKGANLVSPKSGRFSLPTGEGDGGEADVTWGGRSGRDTLQGGLEEGKHGLGAGLNHPYTLSKVRPLRVEK